jgi:SAM-dependent methyltransferase
MLLRRQIWELFIVSFLVLFLELACIRWFPSHVLFLTFFVNLVLLASFVGISIGCLLARSPVNHIHKTPYWLTLAVLLAVIVDRYSELLVFSVLVGEQSQTDVVYFGTEAAAPHRGRLPFVIPIEVFATVFFALIVAIFVGPGQEMGRAFNRVPDRAIAYSANLTGSLAGIAAFAICSYFRIPPPVWFGICVVIIGVYILSIFKYIDNIELDKSSYIQSRRMTVIISYFLLIFSTILTIPTSGILNSQDKLTTWSEYYRVDYRSKNQMIVTNLIAHQLIEPQSRPPEAAIPYALPYLLQRELRRDDGTQVWPDFRRILIIGAGCGNDVARALLFTSKYADLHIDAVEIDPVIQQLGVRFHTDQPYNDPRVHVTINDGRNFLRRTPDCTYDLVIFALVDSLVLQSGYTSLRLESYLFTLESFQDVRRVLKPQGVAVIYNVFRQGWIAARLREQLRVAFEGVDPVVITTPPRDEIRLNHFLPHTGISFFAGGEEVLAPLRQAFTQRHDQPVRFWYPWNVGIKFEADPDVPHISKAQFGIKPPHMLPLGEVVAESQFHNPSKKPTWLGLYPATVEESQGALKLATDDWPFLYTRYARIPSLTSRSMILVAGLSLALWWLLGGRQAWRWGSSTSETQAAMPVEWGLLIRSLFLGAGFMLLETKAVVQMALLFGGTWMVNTVVFAAILLMSLFSNLYVVWRQPKRLEIYYGGLILSLLASFWITPTAFLGWPGSIQILAACLLTFLPIAFAGVVFATTLRRTEQPDRLIGANIAGALLGGLSENTSVIWGFSGLLVVACGFYAISMLSGYTRSKLV